MSDGKRYRMVAWDTDRETGSRSVADIREFNGPILNKRGQYRAFITHYLIAYFNMGCQVELKEMDLGTD